MDLAGMGRTAVRGSESPAFIGLRCAALATTLVRLGSFHLHRRGAAAAGASFGEPPTLWADDPVADCGVICSRTAAAARFANAVRPAAGDPGDAPWPLSGLSSWGWWWLVPRPTSGSCSCRCADLDRRQLSPPSAMADAHIYPVSAGTASGYGLHTDYCGVARHLSCRGLGRMTAPRTISWSAAS